jgi:hypothetical protein
VFPAQFARQTQRDSLPLAPSLENSTRYAIQIAVAVPDLSSATRPAPEMWKTQRDLSHDFVGNLAAGF